MRRRRRNEDKKKNTRKKFWRKIKFKEINALKIVSLRRRKKFNYYNNIIEKVR